jgi:hypothetical protein
VRTAFWRCSRGLRDALQLLGEVDLGLGAEATVIGGGDLERILGFFGALHVAFELAFHQDAVGDRRAVFEVELERRVDPVDRAAGGAVDGIHVLGEQAA